ncbi:MAG: 3-deoxy-D-manno-octulosonic acid kinase [Gammaproteobacteria bacterium]|nr:3-deoxy-D-manno-octulosonic acid kinase [Gammaproteobacteria bacterium]
MRAQSVQVGDAHILYDADAAPDIASQHFDPAWWQQRGDVVGGATGRGAVCFVRGGAAVWALRHYRRGGWMARLSDDRYWWTGLERTRPWREWRLTAALRAQGLPVPEPVAARVVRDGPFYRGDLITRRIEAAEVLADLLHERALPLGDWHRLGGVLRRFQDAGVRHDDINARNVLLDAQGRFHLLDFDKARIVPPGPWRERNLARFRRSLHKFARREPRFHFAPAAWEALAQGYETSARL